MKTQTNTIIYYRRFSKVSQFHFCPAVGYNCPKIPLGSINCKGPDYEIVKIVKVEGEKKHLRNRRVMISWGLNLPKANWPKIKQLIALPIEFPKTEHAEIVLAVQC